MGLADRFYMREAYHPPRMATRLIIVLIVAFVIQSLLLFYGSFDVSENLALSLEGLRHGKVWQLLSFQFLHSAPWPWHVIFNCFFLYFFGRPVEQIVGGRKFLVLYFLSGIIGGLLQVLVTMLPRHPDIPVVGASAGVCGMVAIFCSINPMEELPIWMPITIRARYLLMFLAGFSLFGTLVPMGATAHAAHLGGILTGMAYVRFGRSYADDLPGWIPWLGRRRSEPKPGSFAKSARWLRKRREVEASPDYISQEVDPILDKISAQGLGSLTDKEREILAAARERMAKGKGK